MEDLTRRQREVLDFIYEFVEKNGYPPTHEEIQLEVGLSSKSHVHFYLKALEREAISSVHQTSPGASG